MSEETSENITTYVGQVSVSKQLAERAVEIRRAIDQAVVDAFLNPLTPEQIADEQAAREGVWDEMTAKGLVGISDYADDYSGDWRRVAREGWVERWVDAEAFEMYADARRWLAEAEEGLIDRSAKS